MSKKKIRFILDVSLSSISSFKLIPQVTNIATFNNLDLDYYASDDQILAIGQKEERLILTANAGHGFSLGTITQPKYRSTGVVLIGSEYEEEDIDLSIFKLSHEVAHDDLVWARTRVTLEGATITNKDMKVKIKFT